MNGVTIAVLGGGSWGTALAALGAQAGHAVRLWVRGAAHAAAIEAARENQRYLPGCRIDPAIALTANITAAVAGADVVVVALPSTSVGTVARAAGAAVAPGALIVCASKGFDEATGATLDEVLSAALPGRPVVLLSGPTFAVEIARGLPAAAVVAGRDLGAATQAQKVFNCELFRVYTSDDVAGVAVGGALKNVIAIAAGIADGLGIGNNARAALITRGLNEMGRLAVRLGGNPLTLAGLAGLGDLVLTCTGELSRNRRVGLALGAGEALPAILAKLGQVAEGIDSARIAAGLAERLGVEMPITRKVADVVAGRRTAKEAVADLLSRESGFERG